MPLRLPLASLAGGAGLFLALVSLGPTVTAPSPPPGSISAAAVTAGHPGQGRGTAGPAGSGKAAHAGAAPVTTGDPVETGGAGTSSPKSPGATLAPPATVGPPENRGTGKSPGASATPVATGDPAQNGDAGTSNRKATGAPVAASDPAKTGSATAAPPATGDRAKSGNTAPPGSSGGALTVGSKIGGYTVKRVLHVVATAYGPSLQDNYPYGAVDAFGSPLVAGDIAVDPRVIPLRSHLYVAGYKSPSLPHGGEIGWARDTGGAIKGERIDIFINGNARQVADFGIQPVTVYVLS